MTRTQAFPARARPQRQRTEPYFYLGPSLLLIALVMLVPLIIGVAYSFQHLVVYDPLGNGAFVGLANYRQILADPLFWNALGNTLKWTLSSLALQIALGLGLALLLKTPFKGRGLSSLTVSLRSPAKARLNRSTWL